ncbi:T9SS type A sorting domain-containing protein [Candidatus Bipolaricaulota bacterium]|nr:T9SS type A sorting domain-containing protein [Candidatus Bipolaricaulota bacterium]
MKKQLGVISVMTLLIATLFTLTAFATDAQMYFSSDKNGQNRVTNIQEGDEIFIVVIDNDQNIDCDIRDKMWVDLKIFDPKTGAYIVWDTGGYIGADPEHDDADTNNDFLEETGSDTGVFTSSRSFQVGTRADFGTAINGRHALPADSFQWGHYIYVEGRRGTFDTFGEFTNIGGIAPPPPPPPPASRSEVSEEIYGRFENMDSLIGMYQDPNQPEDVAIAMMKIIDTEATISWDQEIYKDANTSATITVIDPDENINCNKVEYVPVFVIVNPGSWNPVDGLNSPTNFCMLKTYGGVDPGEGNSAPAREDLIRWYNIYDSGLVGAGEALDNGQPTSDGAYYIEYATIADIQDVDEPNVTSFDTVDEDGFCRVMFYAMETGVSTGIFELNINQILKDLGFNQLDVRDVLVAYYLDPNDTDDFTLATAYIEERQHSITSFTDANRADKEEFSLGRDPVYVQVIDANANVDPCCPEQVVVHICDVHGEDDSEWIVLDETSSNSPVFFSYSGMQLWPVWDALGVGLQGDAAGGFWLTLDNWKLEAFNEDSIYVRYNDVYYVDSELAALGDLNVSTAFPPEIRRIRVDNDVSFDMMSITDTQVYDGASTTMYFLDRQGNRISGYVNSDCVFIEVVDPDQDEDQYRRERVDGYWDGGQNYPFGPIADVEWDCPTIEQGENPLNDLLGHTTIFNESSAPKVYVLNPRSGYWASVDLLETGVATGDFVSISCIDLTSVYECVPQLGVLPGDTLVAFYQDPSNHSDSAMISIKVGVGGGSTPPSQMSTTMFVDASGNEVANYNDTDTVYVKVVDPSHAGATLLANAVEIDGIEYDLTPFGAADTFMTTGLDLGIEAGATITATYVDPTDPTDSTADTITVIASELVIESFYAGPNPFDAEVTFGYIGSGIATTMTVTVYDLAGGLVWESTQTDVTEITWDGAGLSNGAYIFTITATDGTNNAGPFTGKLFINR